MPATAAAQPPPRNRRPATAPRPQPPPSTATALLVHRPRGGPSYWPVSLTPLILPRPFLAIRSATQAYFTVAECMQRFALASRLGAVSTGGRRWIALETRDQMESTLRSAVGGDGQTRFPWQVRMARASTLSSSLHLATSAAGDDGAASAAAIASIQVDPAPSSPVTASSASLMEMASSPTSPRRLVLPLAAADDGRGQGEAPAFLPASEHAQRNFLLLPSSPPRREEARSTRPSDGFGVWFGDGEGKSEGQRRGRMRALAQPLLSGLSSAYAYAAGVGGPAAYYDADDGFSIDEHLRAPEVRSSVGTVGGDMQALSIELPPLLRGVWDDDHDTSAALASSSCHSSSYAALRAPPQGSSDCYLIELVQPPPLTALRSPSSSSIVGVAPPLPLPPPSPRRWLALPAPIADAPALPAACGGYILPSPPLLPPAVDSVTLTEVGASGVAVTVHKSVPTVGWLLLVFALLTCYSGAPVTDLQRNALPSEGTTFLRSAWRGMCSSLACGLCSLAYTTSRRDLARAASLRLSRRTSFTLLAAGGAFVLNFGMFNLSLENTSISHAALFESCSSLYIVIGRLLAAAAGRAAPVPRLHSCAVLLGGVGAFLATRDAPVEAANGAETAVSTPVTMLGDVMALSSGLGASVYLSLAEAIRVDVDALAFFTLVMAQFSVACFLLAFAFDDEPPSLAAPFDSLHGVLGWMTPSPARLGTQLWLALVVDLAGNFGFIAVMAYVPALTVAAIMLLGPLTSCLEGIVVGVDQLPGVWTLVGSVMITAGSGIISFSTSERTTTVEIDRD